MAYEVSGNARRTACGVSQVIEVERFKFYRCLCHSKPAKVPHWRIRKRFPSFSGGSVTEGFDQTLADLSNQWEVLVYHRFARR
jgi:hypothetical protein